MCKELTNMINRNSLTVKGFFTMDPFSYANDRKYGKFEREVNFFEDLFVVSNKTYERLATIADLAVNDELSALVITGYSGSGKTNFLRYCQAIMEGKVKIPKYSDVQKEMEYMYEGYDALIESNDSSAISLNDSSLEREVSESSKINEEFDKSIETIRNMLGNYYGKDTDAVRSTLDGYLNEHIKGLTVYLDFDADKQDDIEPLEIKLTRQIETHLKPENSTSIERVYKFYERNKPEFRKAFEGRSSYLFGQAIEILNKHKNETFEDYKLEYIRGFNTLDIDQLLCIEVLLKISENLDGSYENIFYFIDNIDMISGTNNKVLINTVSKFWDFIKEIQSFMLNIKGTSSNEPWIKTYGKIKYIFSMRETTAMHICDHLRSRISTYAKQFDSSMDINKSFVFKKRYDFIKKYIDQKKITNNAFIGMVQCIEAIVGDNFYKWNFFEFFNNDYRKAVDCLCAMSEGESEPIYQCIDIIKGTEKYKKYGGRGVVIKALCDSFKSWNYFECLGIPMKDGGPKIKPYNITLIRIILTVLENLQKEIKLPEESMFFIKRENCVSLRKLYKHVGIFCDKETFLKCIENMFAGRTWSYWNHLITFDNIFIYSYKDLEDSLNDYTDDVYVRITKAGERYLNSLCVHYEFFVCRYIGKCNGLFTQMYRKNGPKYSFENEIQQVKKRVIDCCNELKQVNLKLMEYLDCDNLEDLLGTVYVKNGAFHSERIIHNHISYLDSFRIFLINGPLKNDVKGVNESIISHINDYLELLKCDGTSFYSKNSESLYQELKSCVNKIKETDYDDVNTIISRTYYREKISS